MSAAVAYEVAVGSENRRRHVRVRPAKGAPIRVDINGPGFMEVLDARDISVSGVGVDVPHRFERCRVDQSVRLLVRLPGPDKVTIHCSGRIRHIGAEHFGVLFTHVKPADQKALRRYVKSRLAATSLWTRLRFALHLI